VTADVGDLGGLASNEHRGVVLGYDQRLEPCRVANGVLDTADADGSRERFVLDAVDNWR
jgi:hypothetical protein